MLTVADILIRNVPDEELEHLEATRGLGSLDVTDVDTFANLGDEELMRQAWF